MKMLFLAAVISSIAYLGYRECPEVTQWVDQSLERSKPAVSAVQEAADKVAGKAKEFNQAHPEVEEFANKVKDKVVETVAEQSNEAIEALAKQVQNLERENQALRQQLEQSSQPVHEAASEAVENDPYQSPYQPVANQAEKQQPQVVNLDNAEDVTANGGGNDNSVRREQLLQLAERMELRALELMGE